MNLDVIVNEGNRPWLPSVHATDLDVWAADDVPMLGTFKLAGCTVLFMCVSHVEDEDLTPWVYAPLSSAEVAVVDKATFEGEESMWRFAEALTRHRELVYAHSSQWLLDRHWSPIYCHESILDGAIQYLKWVRSVYSERAQVLASSPSRTDKAAAVVAFEQADIADQQLANVERLVSAGG
jgi:hypothetical protein